jgi:hypothetical protein
MQEKTFVLRSLIRATCVCLLRIVGAIKGALIELWGLGFLRAYLRLEVIC